MVEVVRRRGSDENSAFVSPILGALPSFSLVGGYAVTPRAIFAIHEEGHLRSRVIFIEGI
jgi:hypothetical protein